MQRQVQAKNTEKKKNYLKKRKTEREGDANAPSERTDGAAYGENRKEAELSLVCPFRFFFIHPVLPADFRQAYRTLPFSRKKSFFLQMPIDKTEKSIIIKSGKHW